MGKKRAYADDEDLSRLREGSITADNVALWGKGQCRASLHGRIQQIKRGNGGTNNTTVVCHGIKADMRQMRSFTQSAFLPRSIPVTSCIENFVRKGKKNAKYSDPFRPSVLACMPNYQPPNTKE